MSDKPKKNSRTKEDEEELKAPVTWDLTEEDKSFLRSCSIRPD